MSDTGTALGVDLHELYTMSTRYLPDVAGHAEVRAGGRAGQGSTVSEVVDETMVLLQKEIRTSTRPTNQPATIAAGT